MMTRTGSGQFVDTNSSISPLESGLESCDELGLAGFCGRHWELPLGQLGDGDAVGGGGDPGLGPTHPHYLNSGHDINEHNLTHIKNVFPVRLTLHPLLFGSVEVVVNL